jgi:signal peptidase I
MQILSKFIRSLIQHRLIVACAALLLGAGMLRQYYQLTIVVGESMLPTLQPGELLLVNRRAYTHESPSRGDVIVAHYGQDFILKRIVGLPGEEVEVRRGVVYVDGKPQPESHATEEGSLEVAKGTLMDNDFATLGDNRAIPAALAVHPVLSKPDILGKVILSLGRLPWRR